MKETKFLCPECGEKIYYKLHKEIIRNRVQWKIYYCLNQCELNCGNCRNSNTHGECNLTFCYNLSGWEPEEI